ncbi:hypothetical protein XaC1_379 [Xanthomonas phage XaC1]|nr:hypothetical protein XaC1_379 [Xanthomonas phage XaC1]
MAKTLKQLLESNMEKAEIVLAVKGEIVDKLQRQAEVINNMGVDVLGPLLDRIKAEHGLESAEQFKNEISGYLDTAVKTIMDVKDKISTETLKLTGDITAQPGVADLGAGDFDSVDVQAETPTFDMEADAELPDVDLSEPVPDERAMKESTRKLGLVLESKSGKQGTKYFTSKDEMNTWIAENKSKISKVLKVIK